MLWSLRNLRSRGITAHLPSIAMETWMPQQTSKKYEHNRSRMYRLDDNRVVLGSALLFFIIARTLVASNEIFELTQPSSCKNDEYFDARSFSCHKCDTSKGLRATPDHSECVCNRSSKTIDFKNGNPICASCGQNFTVTQDGEDCIPCIGSKCRCSSREIRVERLWNGSLLNAVKCLPCPANTYPSAGMSKCLPCSRLTPKLHANCVCPEASHLKIQGYCLNRDDLADWPNVRGTYLTSFRSQKIDSYYLRTELQAATYLCKKKNRTACVHLSHMCVLTLQRSSVPCALFTQTHMSPLKLFYNRDEISATLNAQNITQMYSLKEKSVNNTLNFTMATFSLDGKLLSIDEPNFFCNFLTNVRFGINLRKKCTVASGELLKAKMQFLQAYLTFKSGDRILSYQLPILIKEHHQEQTDIFEQQFVTKFFLVDNISGIKALPNFITDTFLKTPKVSVLRYAKSLHVLINVRGGEFRGGIYPPLFITEYAELTEQELAEKREVVIDCKVTFMLKENNLSFDVQIFVGVLSTIAILYSALKAWIYCKKNYECVPNSAVLVWFFIYATGAIGNTLIFVSITLCVYLFIFYKGQTVPYILLPDETVNTSIEIFTLLALSLKVVELIGFIYQYWHIHIFFIDWEQPRPMHTSFKYDSPRTSLRKLYANRLTKEEKKDEERSVKTPSEIIAAKRKRIAQRANEETTSKGTSKSFIGEKLQVEREFLAVNSFSKSSIEVADSTNSVHDSPVSTWRTYFVANKWLKLQEERRINIFFQMIATLFILEVVGIKFWSLATPELKIIDNELPDVRRSFILQYAVCTFVYASVYLMQYLISIVFYERFMKNQMQEFIDLCSITNISVFLLKHNYYGFYIHGRSVHGFADTDLVTLINNLHNEQNHLCAHRGLVPGTTEQTFVVLITQSFRTLYETIYREKYATDNKFLKTAHTSMDLNQAFDTRLKLNRLLCQFIDHTFKDEDYIIKEQHVLEKLCDIYSIDTKEKSIFYIDNNYSFGHTMLYRNEWLLATLEITIFLCTLVLRENYIFASTITVLLSQFLCVIIKYVEKKTLSNKSLLDERFLM